MTTTTDLTAAALAVVEAGLADAVNQGWGREAANVLNPVCTAIRAGHRAHARDVVAETMRFVAADPNAARGLFIEEILRRVDAALMTPAERAKQDAANDELAADILAFHTATQQVTPATPVARIEPGEPVLF